MPLTREEALARYPGADFFTFGDSEALNAELLALVRTGVKTVTCDAVASFRARNEPVPQPGKVDIALDWQGRPALAIRTLEVETIRFSEMDAARVAPQGEFRDVEHWREGYEAYLRRAGVFAPDAPMVVERFRVVEDFG